MMVCVKSLGFRPERFADAKECEENSLGDENTEFCQGAKKLVARMTFADF